MHGEAWDVVCPQAAGVPEGVWLSMGTNPGLCSSLWRAELKVIIQIEVICVCVCVFTGGVHTCERACVCMCLSSYSPC